MKKAAFSILAISETDHPHWQPMRADRRKLTYRYGMKDDTNAR